MIKVTKQDIRAYPFEEFADVPLAELDELAKESCIIHHNSWMLPQLMAFWGSLDLYKNDAGKYDARMFLDRNIGRDKRLQGMWRVCAKLRRGSLIKGQNTIAGAPYSALVPFILAGVKKFKGVGYTEWELEPLKHLVDSLLYEAMTYPVEDIPVLSTERLMEIRTLGLTTQTGKKSGEVVHPISKWKLTGIKGTELGVAPVHITTMLCQTWVAHHSLRNPLMILNPFDWDGPMPAPLIDTEVITVTPKDTPTPEYKELLPWE